MHPIPVQADGGARSKRKVVNNVDDNIPKWAVHMNALVEQVDERTKKLDHLLTGNGDPERGVVVRLDRIEQRTLRHDEREREVRGVAWTALGAGVLAIGGVVWKFITGQSHGGAP